MGCRRREEGGRGGRGRKRERVEGRRGVRGWDRREGEVNWKGKRREQQRWGGGRRWGRRERKGKGNEGKWEGEGDRIEA